MKIFEITGIPRYCLEKMKKVFTILHSYMRKLLSKAEKTDNFDNNRIKEKDVHNTRHTV